MTPEQTFTRSITRRHFIKGLTVTVSAVTVLSACGNDASIGTSGGPVTLNFWGGVPPENGPKRLVDAFQQKYPDMKVKYTRFVNDDQGNVKLDTALASGTPIDVFMSYTPALMTRRIDSGLMTDLATYIDADKEIKDWVNGAGSGVFKYKNTCWGLPIAKGPNYVFVNKNLVEQAGITLPQTWTADEFRAIAKTLSTDKVYGTFDTPDLAYQLLGPDGGYKNGGKESNIEHPIFRQSLQLHRQMIEEKAAFPWTEVLAQNLRVYAQSIFLKGQVAMAISGDFWHRYITDSSKFPHDFVTTFMPMPTPAGATDPYTIGGLNNWIHLTARSKQKDAAWKFLRFNLGEGAQYMIASGRNPALPGTSADAVVAGLLGANREKLYDVAAYKRVVLETKHKFALPTITTASAELTKIAQAQTDRYFVGEISLDQCIKSIKEQSDVAITKAGK